MEIPAAGTYAIDRSQSSVEFVGRHLMITKVRGRFTDFDGEIEIAEPPEGSSVVASIATASVHTADDMRDGHLRGPDFLDAEQYPTITFRSTGVEPGARGSWKVHGDLTVRHVSRPVVLDVEFDGTRGERIAFRASTEVDREHWGLTWNPALETGGLLVGKRVRIELRVEATRT